MGSARVFNEGVNGADEIAMSFIVKDPAGINAPGVVRRSTVNIILRRQSIAMGERRKKETGPDRDPPG
jgi:hypothetical protein